MTPLIDWDSPNWGGHIHIASSDDLGKHGKHCDETDEAVHPHCRLSIADEYGVDHPLIAEDDQ